MLRLLRSASVRIALIFAGLFVLAALALAAVLWFETGNYLEAETDAVIVADTQAIGDRLRDFGLPGAMATIGQRVKETADEHAIYLLTDPALNPVAGNLTAWPAAVAPPPGWYGAILVRDGKPYAARLLHVPLPNGFQLLVGRDVQQRVALRATILHGLGWSAAVALALAILGGMVVRRAVLRRIALIGRTTEAIVQGDLTKRLPAGGAEDEFGRLARTINEMLAQIEVLVDGVRNASNAVAHDLRTPLAELRTRLEEIAQRLPEAEPDLAALRAEVVSATADVDRLIGIFNALLRLAAIDSGARRAAFKPVALAPLLAQAADLYEPLAEERGVAILVESPPDLAVAGDATMLAQAVGNLIDNALKYAAPAQGSRATLLLAAERRGDGRVAVAVTDRGPGIPEPERGQAAQRFWRGDTSRHAPGVGLGLAEVAAVAKVHGGELVLADAQPGLRAEMVLGGAV